MAEVGSLPFKEQIAYFRDKVNLPTESWTDIWEGMHSRAFVIAGATKEDILTDFRTSIDKAIAEGMTLADFRKDFDAIVEKHGWSYNGGRNWRSRVIYDTNLRQSYNAGRELQMSDPELRNRRPYGLYRHGNSDKPRPEHLAWDGLVLPLDDPWWETHTPSNGWGCTCRKLMVSDADVERLKKNDPNFKTKYPASDLESEMKTVGARGPNPRIEKVYKGIDPGFAYNPGTAAWGKQLSEEAMKGWQDAKAAAWEPLTPGDYATYNRPATIPAAAMPANVDLKLVPVVISVAQLQKVIENAIGGTEKVFVTPAKTAINVNAATLAGHIDINRARYIPLLKDLLEDPYEQWLAFDRHKGTGMVVLRTRIIKLYKDARLFMVANAQHGQLESWTFVPAKASGLNKQRRGKLLYGK